MKRKNLPLTLVLITIVLGVISLGFVNFKSGDRPAFNKSNDGSVVSIIKTSSDYLSMIRNNQVTGTIAPEDYKMVQQQLKSFGSDRSTTNLKWTQLGPDNYGGRTRSILFDNQTANGSVLYGAGVTGGIWKSTNIGVTWSKINQASYNLNVSCMAQSADGTLYAGTGELFNSNEYSGIEEMGYTSGFMGQGIFRSTDGDNFSLLAATQPQFNQVESDWAYINELAVEASTGAVFAATNTGLKFSLDKGDSWSYAKDTAGTELNGNAYDVKVSSEGSIIAAVGDACYVSISGDVNDFKLKSTGDSVSLPLPNDVRRIEFAYAPSDPNIVYASVVNKFGSLYNVYLSEDKGDTWRVILPGTSAIIIFDGTGVYNNMIEVFPNDPGRVLLGGDNLWEGTRVQETGFYSWISISQSFSGFFLPSYLHASQHDVTFRPGYDNTFFVANDGGLSIGSYSDGSFRYESSNRNYFTTQFYNVAPSGFENYVLGGAQGNGSIVVSGNGNTNMEGDQILGGNGGACALSLIDRNVMVISSQGGDLYRSEDAGVTFSNQFIDDNFSISADFFNTPIALWESFDNANSRDSLYYHARDTINGGTRIQVLSNQSEQPFYYTTPLDVTLYPGDSLQVCDVVSSRLFIASDNVVGMSKDLHRFDMMPEWYIISNSSAGFIGDPQCLAYSSDANHLFVGMRADGKIYRISNLALAYDYDRADVNSSSCIVSTQEIQLYVPGTTTPITQVVTSIAVDQENPNNIIVTLGNYGNDQYVLYSENALDETPVFTSKQGNLPLMPVYSSLIEMSDANTAILGTEHGIFVNEDIHGSTAQWVKQDSLMGSVPVFQLKQQTVPKVSDTVVYINGPEMFEVIFPGTNNYGIIYAATFGRGLLRSNTYRKPVAIDENEIVNGSAQFGELLVYPNPVSTSATIVVDINHNSSMLINIYDLTGRQVRQLSENVQKGENKIQLDLSDLRSGTYVISAVAGTNMYSQKFIVK